MKYSILMIAGSLLLGACSSEPDPATSGVNTASAAEEVQTAEYIPEELAGSDIRPEVGGLNAAIVSEHPLASQVGYEVLRSGGNATDAAVTMAAMLAVLRPHMNSVGGDTFALFYEADTGAVTALNASGRSAALAEPAFYREQGIDSMPFSGALSVTVPGAVSAWEAALSRYGTRSMSEALQPAIDVADQGFMVSTTLAADLASAAPRLNAAGQAVYHPGDQPLVDGDVLVSRDLAESLRTIASEGAGAMYGGPLGRQIAEFLESEGSPLRLSDFASHEVEWGEPASISFMGRNVHTVRPNSQGIVLLQMLAMAELLPLQERDNNSPQLLHELVELTKIAFADRDRWVADEALADVPVERLLDRDYLAERASLVTGRSSARYESGIRAGMNEDGDTIYLMVVDEQGNAVSWIQSLYGSFGSGLLVPGTGIVLQNRGAGFTLEEGHPNQVAPGKRPFHTLMAAMVTGSDGAFEMTIGTPGGSGQPQFLAQTLIKSLVFGMSPQQAVESPRFRIGAGVDLGLEARMPAEVPALLTERGHNVELTQGWTANFGSVQMIHRQPSGVLRTGADMRREGAAIAY